MLPPPLTLWRGLALATLLLAPLAHAERADRQQPMNIEADSLRYDDARQTSVFTGRVVVSKGSIAIRGQQLEVRQDAQGHQFGLVQGSAGRPARRVPAGSASGWPRPHRTTGSGRAAASGQPLRSWAMRALATTQVLAAWPGT